MSLSRSSSAAGHSSVSNSIRPSIASSRAGTVRVPCLSRKRSRGARGAVAEPAQRGVELAGRLGRVLGGGDQLAAREVDLVLEPDRDATAAPRPTSAGPSASRTSATRVRMPLGQHDDLVARPQRARGQPAGGPARAALAAQHELHRQPRAVHGRRLDRDRLQALQQRRAGVPRHLAPSARRRCRPCSALIGMNSISCRPTCGAQLEHLRARRRRTRSSAKSTRSILLTATITCRIRSRAAIVAWRRLCSVSPARASTSSSARSAVEAPVTMLRVYCAWPGQSARMKRRRGVANER